MEDPVRSYDFEIPAWKVPEIRLDVYADGKELVTLTWEGPERRSLEVEFVSGEGFYMATWWKDGKLVVQEGLKPEMEKCLRWLETGIP